METIIGIIRKICTGARVGLLTFDQRRFQPVPLDFLSDIALRWPHVGAAAIPATSYEPGLDRHLSTKKMITLSQKSF